MSDDATEYNGWKNYETWCVHHWLSNDEDTYRHWRAEARRHRREATSCLQVKDGTWSVEQAIRFNLADELRQEVEHDGGCSFSSLYTDLIQAALSVVEWVEIADAFLEGLDPSDGEATDGEDDGA